MLKLSRYFSFSAMAVFASTAFAHSYGPAPRVTGAPGDNPRACTQCHAGGALNSGSGFVKLSLQGAAVYIPGVKQRITIQVADPNQSRWGFELTARLGSDLEKAQAGDFTPIDNMTQVICEDSAPRPCATGLQFVTHTSAGTRKGSSGGATFQVDWTPPATNAGPVTLYVAGNAANGNDASSGDLIYTSSVELKPAIASPPAVSAGNVVSSATNTAGPLSQNSWATIYGTNLSVTTRSWTLDDFVNGGMPFSIDGLSVVLTLNGTPRLAYVGYVSPTQVNFLFPSDYGSGSPTVMVKNPAGTTTPVSITTQAVAPQLFTVDGTRALGTHANGNLLGKGSPAVPGETVVIYGTGLGATSPVLVPGTLPTSALSLATKPTVTIGGSNANVIAAVVVPGTAGLYQINVQVPMDATNGDLPVVVSSGAAGSATTTLTVQK